MKKLLLALALLFPGSAWAQCTGVFPPNTLCGNLSGSPAPPSAFSAGGTVVGPGSSVVNDIAVWNNTGGSSLKDVPPLQIFGTQANNTFLSGPSTGGPLNPTFRAITQADIQTAFNAALTAIHLPTTQSLLSSSGTYTTPAGVVWIEIELQGAGGGGSGGGTSASTNGGAGGNTCWNTSGAACTSPVYQAGGGGGGIWNSTTMGAGGAIGGSGTCYKAIVGAAGGQAAFVISNAGLVGGPGGSGPNGGAGVGGDSTTVGTPGVANTGGGGGGGGSPSGAGFQPGNGGGSGAVCRIIIPNSTLVSLAGTYTYAIGVAGTAGATSGSGSNGTVGGSGGIWVIEHYAP